MVQPTSEQSAASRFAGLNADELWDYLEANRGRLTDAELAVGTGLLLQEWLWGLQRSDEEATRFGARTADERRACADAARRCRDAAIAAAEARLAAVANPTRTPMLLSRLQATLENVGAWRERRTGDPGESIMHQENCVDLRGRALPHIESALCIYRHAHREFRYDVARYLAWLRLELGNIDLRREPDPDAPLVADRLVYNGHDLPTPEHLDDLALTLASLVNVFDQCSRPIAAKRGPKEKRATRRLLSTAEVIGVTQRALAKRVASDFWTDELPDLLEVKRHPYDAHSLEGRQAIVEQHFSNVRRDR